MGVTRMTAVGPGVGVVPYWTRLIASLTKQALPSFARRGPMDSATRPRGRRRPLREFAGRSPLYALGMWLLRSAVILILGLVFFLLVANVAIPMLSDGIVSVIRNR